ncbi:hypothetical protein [Propionivibrio sp.]|uniref:hypothetical protein n=1 Tax=Propionivibrio sp. TaxID=2212460 RepID=UPI003BF2CD49
MNVNEALQWADSNSQPEAIARMKSRAAVSVLAHEVRRLQLYAPAQHRDGSVISAAIAPSNFAFFGVEADEEFAASGREYIEVTE